MAKPPVYEIVHTVGEGSILEIVLNRPEVHHAIDGESADILAELWRRFWEDDGLWVAVLRSEGDKAFCAGADLKGLESLANLSSGTNVPDDRRQGPMGGTRIIQGKPVITASQGFTYAGGLELFCHGHIRIAEPAATFSVACRRWGVPLVDGGTVYLPRLLGWGTALPLIITGQRISAERAMQIGLVWEVVPPGTSRDRALHMARQLCELPQDCLRADLASAIHGFELSMEDALKLEAKNTLPVMHSESTRRGVQNFLDGRRFWFE